MSSIDLAILGMLMERPMSAYEIQKDVESHHFSRWTRISSPSIYKKVLQLKEQGFLDSRPERAGRRAEKAVYRITAAGKKHFERLMDACAAEPVALQFDFNVLVVNLPRMERTRAFALLSTLRGNLEAALASVAADAARYADIPPAGRAVFEQQQRLYASLLDWLGEFEAAFRR